MQLGISDALQNVTMTNFLSLPLELRRKIYGYVVRGAFMGGHGPQ